MAIALVKKGQLDDALPHLEAVPWIPRIKKRRTILAKIQAMMCITPGTEGMGDKATVFQKNAEKEGHGADVLASRPVATGFGANFADCMPLFSSINRSGTLGSSGTTTSTSRPTLTWSGLLGGKKSGRQARGDLFHMVITTFPGEHALWDWSRCRIIWSMFFSTRFARFCSGGS